MMEATGPYEALPTPIGGSRRGGGPYMPRACQSAATYVLAVSVRPTETPPMLWMLLAHTSRNFLATSS